MRNLIYIAGVLSMLTAPGSCQSCNGLKRDIEGCPEVIGTVAQEVAQENYCLRKDNPLSSFLSCAADKNGKNVNLCRNTDDGNRNSNEDYLYQAGTCARPAYTTQPKTLLLESITQSSSNICGVEWYIKNCPENDPRYLECLCQEPHRNDGGRPTATKLLGSSGLLSKGYRVPEESHRGQCQQHHLDRNTSCSHTN
ncbi:hypothetical protein BDZ85DRAFT_15102 [Elsinoe ampelina]|uniref:Cyanovirin-N domain-containing protein n=1 Tax=Elsinoe ampelina TaxID=302913 RepID=A0A6A6G6W5_9PEZI|nr:hypothetical protein BDZ85DRAFT_15102 [Elsinoe ampelina]